MSDTDTSSPDGLVTASMHKCSYPAPYPKVRVLRPNSQYAHLLWGDYAGQVSELTAIAQYVYHYFVLGSTNKEVADLLECISLVEMKHLEILAEIITMLGVDPRYVAISQNNREQYWDASFVFYGTSLCDRITSDIAGEWAAIANYRKHMKMIDDPYIRQILERIIMDELHHINLLNQASHKCCRAQLMQ